MRASTTFSARTAWLSLLAGALALTVWGATLLNVPDSSPELSQRQKLELQIADGGTGRPPGG